MNTLALGPVHTNEFSKRCVFVSRKTNQKACVHTILFRSVFSVHTKTLEYADT